MGKNKVRYLLDTHILLWWFIEPNKIHSRARDIIKDKSNELFVSTASFWELAIKKSVGRITLPQHLFALIAQEQIQSLPILPEEAFAVSDLPLLHQDPFDRLLIIQAKMHDLILITRDEQIKQYPLTWIDG
jgi:PIN domain nuclease of toxin-antitoxin system